MTTLVYSPGVRAHIETTTDGIIDVSEDLVSGRLTLRENAPHTFSFQLQNAQRKYDGRLLPMDKISVQFKRLAWLQCFTGYLNDPPIFQAWPGVLNLTATCTLKVPQFWPWDSTTPQAWSMVTAALSATGDERAVQGDNGLSRLISDSLSKVVGWDPKRIHIGQVPNNWFKLVQPIADQINQDDALYRTLGASYTSAGVYSGVMYPLQPGVYGGVTIDATQAKNASIIYQTIRKVMGISTDPEPVMTLMCALTESELHNWAANTVPGSASLPNDGVQPGDHDSAGLFQQRLIYYGPVGNMMDPVKATQAFVSRLTAKISELRSIYSGIYGDIVQSVQGSSFPDRYQTKYDAAREMVDALNKLAGAIKGGTASIQGNQITAPAAGFTATGSQVIKVAVDLINAHQTDPIVYHESGDDPDTTPAAQVKTLDCSSLVDWAYYNATGQHLYTQGGRSVVGDIRARCKLIDVEAAKYIQGAVLINPPNNHIGISCGDGSLHAAAHMTYPDPHKDVTVEAISSTDGFAEGGLLPGVDYSSSATNDKGKAALESAGIQVKGFAPQLSNVNDPSISNNSGGVVPGSPFQSLIDNVINSGDSDQRTGEVLAGPVALINDQPFLPWLQSIVNSSMRSFCSAPNGDFIAWFPDYFGAWGTAGAIQIEQIELQDFQVNWSDQVMVTHQFVIGNTANTMLDTPSGGFGLDTSNPNVVTDLISLAQGTAGIASMDYPEIFKLIYGEMAPPGFVKNFLSRFGARPDVQQMATVPKGPAEFFMAVYLFIQRWAGMFTASVPLTFMPEVWPGMLLQIPSFGFQAYVQQVVHTFSFGPGGQFTTDVLICAPSNLAGSDRTDLLSLLPQAQKKL